MNTIVLEAKIIQAIRDFQCGKLTEFKMEERLRKLGIEYPYTILTQWELI